MAIKLATLGPKSGMCNICGDVGVLTVDHTPPKGCIRATAVELHHIGVHLSAAVQPKKGSISQNGVKYRTLCHRCNNTLLGANYDPEFIAFVNDAGRFLKSSLHLPPLTSVRGIPQKIIRSVLGHMCAQGTNRYRKGRLTDAVRDYMLDPSLPLPSGIRVYYWLYPFRPQVMVRDAALMDLRNDEAVLFWLMKFFPLAFMITWDEPAGYRFEVESFESWRSSAIGDEVDLPIRLQPVTHQFWPEAPSDTSFVMYGEEAMVALGKAHSGVIESAF